MCHCQLCRERGEPGLGSSKSDVHEANNYRSINPPIVASELFRKALQKKDEKNG